MSSDKRHAPKAWQVWPARAFHRLGIVGLAGGAALLAGVGLVVRHWPREPVALVMPAEHASAAATAASVQAAPEGTGPLSAARDVPLLLTQIEQAAVAEGLGWPQAEYRILPATDDTPASLEVHCTLKGPYPNLRRFVTTLLTRVPASTLREFSLSRPTAETADVEAKLGIVVYLGSGGAR